MKWELFPITGILSSRCGSESCWRHQMETFSALLALCEGNSPVTGEFASRRPVTRSFDVFFDLRLNKRLSRQPRRRWFETPSHSLWRHCNSVKRALSRYSIDLTELLTFNKFMDTESIYQWRGEVLLVLLKHWWRRSFITCFNSVLLPSQTCLQRLVEKINPLNICSSMSWGHFYKHKLAEIGA